jgi:AmiR/NasT family two-component response regulator
MSQQAMSETQAYGLMRQKAMDQKTRIADIAKAVLAMTDQTTAPESRT